MANGVVVSVDSYSNSCTGQILGGMSGGIPNALTPPDKKLTSATMAGSGLVQDFFSGVQIPVSIDVDVIGSGQTSQSKAHSKTKIKGATGGPIIVSTDRSANGNRGATPEGTIIHRRRRYRRRVLLRDPDLEQQRDADDLEVARAHVLTRRGARHRAVRCARW